MLNSVLTYDAPSHPKLQNRTCNITLVECGCCYELELKGRMVCMQNFPVCGPSISSQQDISVESCCQSQWTTNGVRSSNGLVTYNSFFNPVLCTFELPYYFLKWQYSKNNLPTEKRFIKEKTTMLSTSSHSDITGVEFF